MKSTGPTDWHAEYVLDTLSEPERAELAAAAAAWPEAARELDLARQALTAWAQGRVDESPPSPDLRRRILETVGGIGRFGPFVPLLRRLFDLGAQTAADLLAKADGAADWIEAAPGVRYFHFVPGAAVGLLEAGIVRLRPDATFPRHRHRGPEVTLVLDGFLVDRGQAHGPGGIVESAGGSEHDYRAGAGRDLILASLHSGIDFL